MRSPCSTQPVVVMMNTQGICGMASSQYSARCTRKGTRRSMNDMTLRSPLSVNSSRRYPSLPTVPLGICAGSS